MRGLLRKESTQVVIVIGLSNMLLVIAQILYDYTWLTFGDVMVLLYHSCFTTIAILATQLSLRETLHDFARSFLKVRKLLKVCIAALVCLAFCRSYFMRLALVGLITSRGLLQLHQRRQKVMITSAQRAPTGSDSSLSPSTTLGAKKIQKSCICATIESLKNFIARLSFKARSISNAIAEQSNKHVSHTKLTPDTPPVTRRLFSFRSDSGNRNISEKTTPKSVSSHDYTPETLHVSQGTVTADVVKKNINNSNKNTVNANRVSFILPDEKKIFFDERRVSNLRVGTPSNRRINSDRDVEYSVKNVPENIQGEASSRNVTFSANAIDNKSNFSRVGTPYKKMDDFIANNIVSVEEDSNSAFARINNYNYANSVSQSNAKKGEPGNTSSYENYANENDNNSRYSGDSHTNNNNKNCSDSNNNYNYDNDNSNNNNNSYNSQKNENKKIIIEKETIEDYPIGNIEIIYDSNRINTKNSSLINFDNLKKETKVEDNFTEFKEENRDESLFSSSRRKRQHPNTGLKSHIEYGFSDRNSNQEIEHDRVDEEDRRSWEGDNEDMNDNDERQKKRIGTDFRNIFNGARALIVMNDKSENNRNHSNKRYREKNEEDGRNDEEKRKLNPIGGIMLPYSEHTNRDRNNGYLLGSKNESLQIMSGRPILKRTRKIILKADNEVEVEVEAVGQKFSDYSRNKNRRKSEVQRAVSRFLGDPEVKSTISINDTAQPSSLNAINPPFQTNIDINSTSSAFSFPVVATSTSTSSSFNTSTSFSFPSLIPASQSTPVSPLDVPINTTTQPSSTATLSSYTQVVTPLSDSFASIHGPQIPTVAPGASSSSITSANTAGRPPPSPITTERKTGTAYDHKDGIASNPKEAPPAAVGMFSFGSSTAPATATAAAAPLAIGAFSFGGPTAPATATAATPLAIGAFSFGGPTAPATAAAATPLAVGPFSFGGPTAPATATAATPLAIGAFSFGGSTAPATATAAAATPLAIGPFSFGGSTAPATATAAAATPLAIGAFSFGGSTAPATATAAAAATPLAIGAFSFGGSTATATAAAATPLAIGAFSFGGPNSTPSFSLQAPSISSFNTFGGALQANSFSGGLGPVPAPHPAQGGITFGSASQSAPFSFGAVPSIPPTGSAMGQGQGLGSGLGGFAFAPSDPSATGGVRRKLKARGTVTTKK